MSAAPPRRRNPQLLYLPADHKIADRREAPDGTVFCSALQHVGIKYGTLTEPMPASPVGRIREQDMPALAEVGSAIWDAVYSTKKPVTAEVRRKGEQGGHRIPRLHAADKDVDALVADIHAETEKIWLTEPLELGEIHRGSIPSGAGTFETVLPTLLFVNGEIRPLGYASYGGLVRGAAQGMPIGALQHTTPAGAVGLRRADRYPPVHHQPDHEGPPLSQLVSTRIRTVAAKLGPPRLAESLSQYAQRADEAKMAMQTPTTPLSAHWPRSTARKLSELSAVANRRRRRPGDPQDGAGAGREGSRSRRTT
ncbi:cucumopine synthase-related protein [Streptomyces kaniharaensis]|uniref:cucumopine synthase-related protein n=1 Tax=Streptomyces kaniharaensis TaxID=212423 RepID=UPI002DDD7935|nr:hypothetical protein [Streptomyces kaniharaensis]